MNAIEPIVLEALFYIFLVISTPAIWWLFSAIGRLISMWLFPVTEITITIDDNGHVYNKVIKLDPSSESDELVQALLKAKLNGGHQ